MTLTLRELRQRLDAGETFDPTNLVIECADGTHQFTCVCGLVLTFSQNSRSYEILPTTWRQTGTKRGFETGVLVGQHSCGATYWRKSYKPEGQ